MSELPYPIQEHIDPRTSPTEVLRDELYYYCDQESFVKNITALGITYNTVVNAPVAKSMMRFAVMLNVAKAWCGVSEPAEDGYDKDFYSGQILGLHTALSATRVKQIRQYVLRSAPQLYVGETTSEEESTLKQMGKMLDIIDDPYTLADKMLDEEHFDVLVEATALYAPNGDRVVDRQISFMSGYLFAYDLYCGYAQQVKVKNL